MDETIGLDFQQSDNAPAALLMSCLRSRLETGSSVELEAAARGMKHDDWENFSDIAQQSRLDALLHTVIKDKAFIPAHVKDRLRQAHSLNMVRITMIMMVLDEAVALLAQQGVNVILLKGTALAKSIYDHDSMRVMNDVDLLIKEKDIEKALNILLDKGYASKHRRAQESLEGAMQRANELIIELQEPINIEFDIHWHLFWFIYYQRRASLDWFWNTTIPVTCGRAQAAILGPEAQILHLCVHYYQHLGTQRYLELRWLHDIAEVLCRYKDELNWDLLLSQAQAFHFVIPLRDTLLRIRGNWKLSLAPMTIKRFNQLEADREEQRAVSQLYRLTSTNMSRYAWRSMLSLPSWNERGRFLWQQILFPSAAFMHDRYGVSNPRQLFVAYFRRWFHGLRNTLH